MRHLILAFCLALGAALQAQETLKLKVDLQEITATEKVYNFISENFVGVIGWQFSMQFDGTKMKFKEIRNAAVSYTHLDVYKRQVRLPISILTVMALQTVMMPAQIMPLKFNQVFAVVR